MCVSTSFELRLASLPKTLSFRDDLGGDALSPHQCRSAETTVNAKLMNLFDGVNENCILERKKNNEYISNSLSTYLKLPHFSASRLNNPHQTASLPQLSISNFHT